MSFAKNKIYYFHELSGSGVWVIFLCYDLKEGILLKKPLLREADL